MSNWINHSHPFTRCNNNTNLMTIHRNTYLWGPVAWWACKKSRGENLCPKNSKIPPTNSQSQTLLASYICRCFIKSLKVYGDFSSTIVGLEHKNNCRTRKTRYLTTMLNYEIWIQMGTWRWQVHQQEINGFDQFETSSFLGLPLGPKWLKLFPN